ncbi:hypothetical protein, partial [uncultured Brachyspira sp.]|uniref:hypothetical protein n=1 Tax=uncultured Brachyspira sp. TaxID=221953 RepID=UPI003211B1F6
MDNPKTNSIVSVNSAAFPSLTVRVTVPEYVAASVKSVAGSPVAVGTSTEPPLPPPVLSSFLQLIANRIINDKSI